MKKVSVILLSLLAVLLSSCGIYSSYGFNYQQLSSINRGMTLDEVCAVLGEPVLRDLNNEGEAWTFRAWSPNGYSVVKVWFKEGKVTEMESYLEDTSQAKTTNQTTNTDDKKESSEKKDSGSKVIVTSDGKHYIKSGNIVITPEGKHIVIH